MKGLCGEGGDPVCSGESGKTAEAAQDGGFDLKSAWLSMLADLNVCSKKGLVEMFDSSIGAATVTMPYGGKYQFPAAEILAADGRQAEAKLRLISA